MSDAAGLLAQLPQPPVGRTGWPWDVESAAPAADCSWPRISIVTPTLNQAGTIEETIRSILLQNYPNLQYIVMDGGSTDGTRGILDRYAPWIDVCISEKDRGQSDALNKGFAHADGAVLAYINSDDHYMPHTFEEVGRTFADDGNLGIVHGYCRIIDEDGTEIRVHSGHIESVEEILDLWNVWWRRRQFVQPEVFWSAAMMKQVGGFREDLYFTMDYEFWTRLFLAGAKVRRIDDVLSAFRITEQQKSRQSARVARELRQVVKPLLWDDSVPITGKSRARLKALWLYDTKVLESVETSVSRGDSRAERWLRLAGQVARHPSLLRHPNLWRRLRSVTSP